MLGETLQTEAAPVNLKSLKMLGLSRLPDPEIKYDEMPLIDFQTQLLRNMSTTIRAQLTPKGTSSSPTLVFKISYHTTEGLSYWLG